MADNYTSFSTAEYLTPHDVELMKTIHATVKEVAEMVREWHETIPEEDEELDVSVKSLRQQVAAKGELHELIHDLWYSQPNYPDPLGSIPTLYVDHMTAEEGRRQVTLYDLGEGDPDVLELILTAFMAKAQDVDCWCVTGSFTCSKPRPDEFGGFAFIVAKNKKKEGPQVIVRWLWVEDWFSQQKRKLLPRKEGV